MSSCSLCNSAWTRWFTGMGWKRDVDSLWRWHLVVIASVYAFCGRWGFYSVTVGRGRILLYWPFGNFRCLCIVISRVPSVFSLLMKIFWCFRKTKLYEFFSFFFFYRTRYILCRVRISTLCIYFMRLWNYLQEEKLSYMDTGFFSIRFSIQWIEF